jgi:hypothetical protein
MNIVELVDQGKLHISVWPDWGDNCNAKAELLRLARLGQKMQLVSVSEKLPEDEQTVIVRNGNAISIMQFNCDGQDSPFWYDLVHGEVHELDAYTHWMLLPEVG